MGKGSIEVLKTGFRARVYAGTDPITGRQTYLRGETRRTRDQAETDCRRLLAYADADTLPDQRATVSLLLTRWMEVVDHEVSTAETTAGYVRRTLNPALGDISLRKLQYRVDIIDRMYTHLRRCNELCDGRPFLEHTTSSVHDCASAKCVRHRCKGMSPGAVRRVHAILSTALNYAVAWGWIEKNPAEFAHPPKQTRRKARPPAEDDVARLLNAAFALSAELGVFLWLAVTTGARRGELTALRWSSVDVERCELVIEKNYVLRAGQRRLKSTKTDEDRRLSLDSATLQILRDFHVARQAVLAPVRLQLPDDAFVFSPVPLGDRPWHPDHFTHAYRELADGLGVTQPLKNLRHFNATQLLTAGVDLRTTAGRLGHGDGGATTLKVYASWTRPADQRAAELLADDLLELRRRAAGGVTPTTASGLLRVERPIGELLTPPSKGCTYLEIAAGVREAVSAGRLEVMDLVPTVTDLAQWFGVARSTAQRAVMTLGGEGLIERRGPRWVVASASQEQRVAAVGE
jgi:integrase